MENLILILDELVFSEIKSRIMNSKHKWDVFVTYIILVEPSEINYKFSGQESEGNMIITLGKYERTEIC